MEKDEFYLTFIHGDMHHIYPPFCPFYISTATVIQSIFMISLIYKNAISLEEILKIAGHKMNEYALEAFSQEIGRHYFEISLFKAGIEN